MGKTIIVGLMALTTNSLIARLLSQSGSPNFAWYWVALVRDNTFSSEATLEFTLSVRNAMVET